MTKPTAEKVDRRRLPWSPERRERHRLGCRGRLHKSPRVENLAAALGSKQLPEPVVCPRTWNNNSFHNWAPRTLDHFHAMLDEMLERAFGRRLVADPEAEVQAQREVLRRKLDLKQAGAKYLDALRHERKGKGGNRGRSL